MSLRDVKARLGAARLVLDRPATPEVHRSISSLQTAAVLEIVASAKRAGVASAAELAELGLVAVEIKFAPGDLEQVLAALKGVKPPDASRKRRRCQQDFLSIMQYGTATLWESLSMPGHRDTKLLDILSLAMSLGLRLPSEHSIKLLCSWWIVISEPEDVRRQMDSSAKLVLLQYVKSELERLRKSLPDPASFIERLPPPAQFAREYPEMYAAVYKSSTPIPPPRALETDVLSLDLSYGCRGGRKSIRGDGHAPSSSSAAGPDPSLVMSRVFERMIDSMMNTSGPRGNLQSGAGIPLIFSNQQPRRLPTLCFDGTASRQEANSQLALMHDSISASEASQVASPPPLPLPLSMGAAVLAHPQSPQSVVPALSPPPLASATPTLPPSLSERPNVADVLSMLDERAKSKASGKGADSSAVAPKSMVKTAMKKAAAKAMKKAAAKSVAAKSSAAKPKAPPIAAEVPLPITEVPLVLGCGKCRRSPKGCGQCRNPAFKGKRGTD